MQGYAGGHLTLERRGRLAGQGSWSPLTLCVSRQHMLLMWPQTSRALVSTWPHPRMACCRLLLVQACSAQKTLPSSLSQRRPHRMQWHMLCK